MKNILVIDDAEDIRGLLTTMLQADGYSVATAEGGVEALAHLDSGDRVDLVVLDVQMPDLDGWATLQRIRKSPSSAQLPVVLCTVKHHSSDLARAWALGADGYITKPFQIADLLAEIGYVLNRTPEQRAVLLEHRRSRVTELAGP
ncbi:MAG: response regulator transcription factor [Acidimicrobiia bacterium]